MMRRLLVPLIVLTLLSSCQPPPIDIRVVRRGAALFVDRPASFWRLLGGESERYAMASLEVFDGNRLLWTLEAAPNATREDVTFPIALGASRPGFVSSGTLSLRGGVQYGVGVEGIGDGRVDFVLEGQPARPRNILERAEYIQAPCGSFWGPICPAGNESAPL